MKRKKSSPPRVVPPTTGCSQEFADLHLSTPRSEQPQKNPEEEQKIEIKTESSTGIILLVERPAQYGRILPHVIRNTFYGIPAGSSGEEKQAVLEKVNEVARSYEANKYITTVKEFSLPFEVKAIGGITDGYKTNAPRPVKAEPKQEKEPEESPKKRSKKV